MPNGLNLARRPFVDTRPVTAAAVVLVITVAILSVISIGTVRRYLSESRGTTQTITSLREEVAQVENRRRMSQAALARFDLERGGALEFLSYRVTPG